MPEPLLVQFGRTIKMHRKQKRMTQEKLAEAAQTHSHTISRIENAKYDVTLTTLAKIARALKVRPYVLLKGIR